MKISTFSKVFCVCVVLLALGLLPRPTLAQRGGHGGGGFHGGGGGFHGGAAGGFHGGATFHGGGGVHYGYGGGTHYAGYRGAAYGWHGGYGWHGAYGWHGRYWGYPRYGWGFGFGWPYGWWGWGYPYGLYSYPWWTPYSYYYPYYPPDDSYSNGNDDPPPADPRPRPNANGPANRGRPPVPESPATTNYTTSDAARTPPAAVLSVDRINATPSNYRVAPAAAQKNLAPRPELQKAMRSLREMPPYARQREIATGRYSHFSPKDKEFLRTQPY